MTKRKVIRKYNKLTPNYYDGGGWFDKFKEAVTPDKGSFNFNFKDTFSGTNVGNMAKGSIGALTTGIGSIGGNLIGGGLQSGAGKAISNIGGTIGGAISTVNPLIGGVVSVGSGLIGGLVNRAFGSKLNKENIARIEGDISKAGSFTTDASSFDQLAENWASSPVIGSFTRKDVGSDGWFSNKAKNKYKELSKEAADANNWVTASLNNNASNINNNTMSMLESNWAAYGGPLGGNAISYELANRDLYNKGISSLGRNKLTSMPSFPTIGTFALGGPMGTNGTDWQRELMFINEGGTHESNPYDGVMLGVDSQGNPNLVEEGEVVWNDYVFSNRLKVSQGTKDKLNIKSKKPMTYADAATILQKESAERPNDPISKNGLEDALTTLMMNQENVRIKKAQKGNKFAEGGYKNDLDFMLKSSRFMNKMNNTDFTPPPLFDNRSALERSISEVLPKYDLTVPTTTTTSKGNSTGSGTGKYNPATLLRYAPVVGSGIASLTDALGVTNKPDYTNPNIIGNSLKGASTVRFSPVGNYLTYTPLDREFYLNSLRAQQGATRRAITNTAGGNRAAAIAGLLASDYNAGNQFGAFARQAEEQNFARRQAVENFNRATNMFNSEGFMKADIANQSRDKLALQAAMAQAEMREQINNRASAARSANLTNFLTSLGNIGSEEVMKSWINDNPAFLYSISTGGRGVKYKGKNGGYLTIKRR